MTSADMPAANPAELARAIAENDAARENFTRAVLTLADQCFLQVAALRTLPCAEGVDREKAIVFEKGVGVGNLQAVIRSSFDVEWSPLSPDDLIGVASELFLNRIAELEAAAASPVAGNA